MKILLVGSGGREHALAWKLAQEAEVIAAPGNPGIAKVARCAGVPPGDQEAIVSLALREAADLVVIGPEDPLIAGLADRIRDAGVACFGPGAEGARLEGSKAFAKQLMREAKVPTAEFGVFTDPGEARKFAAGRAVAVKASGAALGKGVVVCSSQREAEVAIDSMLVDRIFGEAGSTIVVEERLSGPEFSLLTLCSEGEFRSLPVAQDYKRALDGDRGPNTGGMGSRSPVPWLTDDIVRRAEREVVRPILDALAKRGVSYRGVLFSGLMLHEDTPHCLEFNVRFGDPETQSVVLRLGSGLAAALAACAAGQSIPEIEVRANAAVTVVLASAGYPGSYEKGKPIAIGALPPGTEAFQAGTVLVEGQLATHGGRVIAVSSSAATLEDARATAYAAADAIEFEGKTYRRDIAV